MYPWLLVNVLLLISRLIGLANSTVLNDFDCTTIHFPRCTEMQMKKKKIKKR